MEILSTRSGRGGGRTEGFEQPPPMKLTSIIPLTLCSLFSCIYIATLSRCVFHPNSLPGGRGEMRRLSKNLSHWLKRPSPSTGNEESKSYQTGHLRGPQRDSPSAVVTCALLDQKIVLLLFAWLILGVSANGRVLD